MLMILTHLERLESTQLNVGLYTTRITSYQSG